MIKNCKLHYRIWKYWHSAANHCKSLAICTVYDIYLKVCEGKLNAEWKYNHPVNFYTFCDRLSEQLLKYDPAKQIYPGDEKMRRVSHLNKPYRQKRKHDDEITRTSNGSGHITFLQYQELMKSKRVCKTIFEYEKHAHKIEMVSNAARCAVCGVNAYKRCQICKVALHDNDSKGKGKGKRCSLHWHDETYLGLCFADRKILCLPAVDWKKWSAHKLKDNKQIIKGYKRYLNVRH